MRYVGIIGTAGRDKRFTITPQIYKQMVYKTIDRLPNTEITLISGGAALSDHIAVSIFLHKNKLLLPNIKDIQLYIPRYFDREFYGGKEANIANYYHRKFSKLMNKHPNHSLNHIGFLNKTGHVQQYNWTFWERNKQIADKAIDMLIAFGWEDKPTGGTKHTWSLSNAKEKVFIKI